MLDDLTTWQAVAADSELLDAARALDARDVQSVATLRKRWPLEAVRIALEISTARRRAIDKGWPNAATLIADVQGVEQATSFAVGQHKVARMTDCLAPHEPVFDLCCGIGGDAIPIARHFEQLVAIDRSATRAFMTAHNAGCEVMVADVTEWRPPGDGSRCAVHIDPARRHETSGARHHAFEDYEPGPATIARLLGLPGCDVAVKLGPGIDIRALAPHLPSCELEFVSDRRELVQAILWSARLCRASGSRTATALRANADAASGARSVLTLTERPCDLPLSVADLRAGDLLHVPDPALERADLVGTIAVARQLTELHPGIGLLVGPLHTPCDWLSSYRVHEVMPWRQAKLTAWLRSNDAGVVAVKTRGKAIDAGEMQRELRGAGTTPFVVFGLRLGTRRIGVIASPTDDPARPAT